MKPFSIRLAISCCLLVLLLAPQEIFPQSAPEAVVAAARDGVTPFLQSIPESDRGGYGLTAQDNLNKARLGKPFQLYSITPDRLQSADSNSMVDEILSPTNTWFFPVEISGQTKNILTVTQMNGIWKAVAIGKAALAQELAEIRTRWKTQGYQLRLIAVYQASAYFFNLPDLDQYNLTPLSFDGMGFAPGLKTGKGYPNPVEISQILPALKKAVKTNLKNQNF